LEVFIFALSLSVMLLLTGFPVLPGLSSFSFSHCFIFFTLFLIVSTYCSSCCTSSLFASVTSISRCLLMIFLTTFSIFSFFFFNSAFVPLHSFDALLGILHPSTANISFPIKSISSQTISTCINNRMISSLAVEIKSAIVVKCGWVSADNAMNITFSLQHRAIFLLEVIPREYAKSIIFRRIDGSYAGAPVSSFL